LGVGTGKWVAEAVKYNLDILKVQKFRLPNEDCCEEGNHVHYHGKANKDHCFGTFFLVKRYLEK
jgi:hypothetical protein